MYDVYIISFILYTSIFHINVDYPVYRSVLIIIGNSRPREGSRRNMQNENELVKV